MSDLVTEVLNSIKKMSMGDVVVLVKELEKEYGVSSAPVMMGAPVASSSSNDSVKEEKTSFNVILKSHGAKKIAVIKEVRAITGLGLKEVKDLVETGGKLIKSNVDKKEADELKSRLEKVGATIELE